jgi:pimeloyl-ACP methyl ester carboxylesterase
VFHDCLSNEKRDLMQPIQIETPQGPVAGAACGRPDASLVLGLHGWSQRNGWRTWEPLLAPLAAAGYRVVSVDMPGWGGSPAWGRPMSDPDVAVAAVLDLLTGLGAATATLMGKSWGGAIALETALRHPARVPRLILTAPAFGDLARLAQVRQPVLLAWAQDDPVIPVARAKHVAEALPNCRLLLYPTGGHSAAPKNATTFAPEAVAFLEATEAQTSQ